MGFISVKCPDCGADIQLDDSREFGFCNYCGAKVVQDKIVVEHRGSVQLDETDALKKLYQAARNARDASDDASALKHYENISAKDPNSWEALFYSVVLQLSSIKNAQISSAAIQISNCLPKVFQLIKTYVQTEEEQKEAVTEVVSKCYSTSSWLFEASCSFYEAVTKGNGRLALTGVGGMVSAASSGMKAAEENQTRCVNIANIMCRCGNNIESTFDMQDEDYQRYAAFSWKKMLEFHDKYKAKQNDDLFSEDSLIKFSTKVNKYDSTYKIYEKTKSGGCYVATCVYGSYDCPQVWTLRRYRDDTLASTWFGRAFIRTYYAVSPTLVAWFGHTDWFKKLWRGKLDRMVESLRENGVADTPYNDKPW